MNANNKIILEEYSTKRSLEDVYGMYASDSNLQQVLYEWGGFNEWLFLQINQIRGENYDNLMLLISQLASHQFFLSYLGVFLGLITLSLIIRKITRKGGIKPRLAMWFGILLVMLSGFVVNGYIVREAKDYLKYPRPYTQLAESDVQLIEEPDQGDAKRSLPSGHVAFITFLIISLWPAFADSWKWYSLLGVLAVGWSRVSLGMHYPADVLWSFLMVASIIVLLRLAIYFLLRKLFGIIC